MTEYWAHCQPLDVPLDTLVNHCSPTESCQSAHMSKPELITLGCRLNSNESQAMLEHAQSAGLTDTVIINTCAVTNEAVRRAEQTIRRTKREKPNSRIVVTGCAAQIDPDRFAKMAMVDHVIGNDEKTKRKTFHDLAAHDSERVRVNDIMSVTENAPHLISGFGNRARAYVQVQNGCDHRCTFCIIPFGRGQSRSVPAGEVVRQIRKLVENGYKEVVLTGVDMTSYGPDLPGDMSLGRLVRHILAHVPDLERLRLSSIDQVEVDEPLMHAISTEQRLMPHLHLSMQSGNNMILKRMKRRHTREEAITFCKQVKKSRPDIVFGADLIAGFPTESQHMFEDTCNLIEECDLTYLHIFPFSPRNGTPAARMPQIDRTTIKQRAALLRDIGTKRLSDHFNRQIGQRIEIAVEKNTTGHARDFTPVTLDREFTPGALVHATVTHHDGQKLFAEVRS